MSDTSSNVQNHTSLKRPRLGRLQKLIRLNEVCTKSDTIYVTGIPRTCSEADVRLVLGAEHSFAEFEWDRRTNKCWVKYPSIQHAANSVVRLHQQPFAGRFLNVRFELGLDANGKYRTSRSCHTTIVRKILGKRKHTQSKPVYATKYIEACGQQLPFPTGMYLSRLIHVLTLLDKQDPLMELLTAGCLKGFRYSKEISESMAMVDCTERALKMFIIKDQKNIENVDVFVLGDGKVPLCSACMLLHFPPTWQYHSIDPLLDDKCQYNARIHSFKGMSQSFSIPKYLRPETKLVVVVACHSHAPLQEFWRRIPAHISRIAISMACCSDYSELPNEVPIIEFEDFEVYSPKRLVKVFARTGRK